ncbi:hypothetical protein LPTSP4_33690 [Leptospira ryugenii]|uniref:PF07611 family protein n=1 Tax=Leptospira ryugenii TaxID=1917863 RepID=A0A2P2E4M5_9LEPT|nr:DUF1574 domain-containing protein [Leptospira ryugenii]GBF51831.1 hypothetical protein LPTSP4_33690 [Leptospira ryugenii]
MYLLLFLFGIDSIFRIPYVQLLTKLDLTPINYKAKSDLLDQLIETQTSRGKGNKKLMIILGSSRLLYFDADDLRAFYPDWEIYNLSSAVTTPAYYDYNLYRLLEANIKPDLVLLETDPNQFNQNSIFKISNLTFSFDLPYVLKNLDLFGKEHLSFFLGRRLFAIGTYKPYLDQIWRNSQNENLAGFLDMRDKTYQHLLSKNGHGLSPIDHYTEKDSNVLELTSHRTLDWLFSSYQPSKMQFGFFTQLMERLKEAKVRTIIIWPSSSRNFEMLMEKQRIVEEWEKNVDTIATEYGSPVLKLKQDPNYSCSAFADGGHIAKECYHSLMRAVLLEYFRRYESSRL